MEEAAELRGNTRRAESWPLKVSCENKDKLPSFWSDVWGERSIDVGAIVWGCQNHPYPVSAPLQMGPWLPWVNCDLLPSLLFLTTDPATQTCLLSCPEPARPAASPTRIVPSPVGACVTVTCPRNHSLRNPLRHSALCLLLPKLFVAAFS